MGQEGRFLEAERSRGGKISSQETAEDSRSLEHLVTPIVNTQGNDDAMESDDDDEFGQDFTRERWTERMSGEEEREGEQEEEELFRRYSEVFGEEIEPEVDERRGEVGQRGLSQRQGVERAGNEPNQEATRGTALGASAQRGTGASWGRRRRGEG